MKKKQPIQLITAQFDFGLEYGQKMFPIIASSWSRYTF